MKGPRGEEKNRRFFLLRFREKKEGEPGRYLIQCKERREKNRDLLIMLESRALSEKKKADSFLKKREQYRPSFRERLLSRYLNFFLREEITIYCMDIRWRNPVILSCIPGDVLERGGEGAV